MSSVIHMDGNELAQIIERFIKGNIGDYEWDDLSCCKLDDAILEHARKRAMLVERRFPSNAGYCSEEGFGYLTKIAIRCRAHAVSGGSNHPKNGS